MAPTRCVSSHLMSHFVTWRNPQGREEGWMNRFQTSPGAEKRLVCAVGFGVLSATAAVETIAFGAISLLTLTVYPWTDRPFQYTVQLLKSSSFTTLWAGTDALIFNWLFPNLMTHESFARGWSRFVNPTNIDLFRLEDQLFIAEWENNLRGAVNDPVVRGLAVLGADVNKTIRDGATFITENLIAGADTETLEAFETKDPSIIIFILTKAVFIYAFGSKLNDDIPKFFKEETRAKISELRSKNPLPDAIKQELNQIMGNFTSYEKGISNKDAQTLFNELRAVASKELHGSLFMTSCWDQAASTL